METLIANLVSFLSTTFTYKGYKESQTQTLLTQQQSNVEYLRRYSDALINEKRRIEPYIQEISDTARIAFHNIINDVDRFSQDRKSGELATEDILSEIGVHLFNAFSYEMPWQTSLNLYERFKVIFNLEIDFDKLRPNINKINIVDSYNNWKNEHLEIKLRNTKEFVDLLASFFNSIDSENRESIYRFCIDASEPVFCLLKDSQMLFKKSIANVETIRSYNEIEEIRISDSMRLSHEFKSFTRKLQFLEHFFLIEHIIICNDRKSRLSQVLLIVMFLMLLKNHSYWGNYIGV